MLMIKRNFVKNITLQLKKDDVSIYRKKLFFWIDIFPEFQFQNSHTNTHYKDPLNLLINGSAF